MEITKFWKGYISGTNRGTVAVRIKQQGDALHGKAILFDHLLGPSIVSLVGKLDGTQVAFRLFEFWGISQLAPLDGQLALTFKDDFKNADGPWRTDIGTNGTCQIRAVSMSTLRWWLLCLAVWLKVLGRQHKATGYALVLLTIAVLSLTGIIQVTYPALILLLIPAPYIFQSQLAELIRAFRVKKIGPIEMQEPQNPMTEDIRRSIAQLVQQHVQAQVSDVANLLALDGFFVLRTKLVLIWLAQSRTVNRAQFTAYATAIGVPADNLDVTWNAMLESRCAILEAGNLTITLLGQRYVAYLLSRAVPSQTPNR